ncbi:MAG: TMEM175 family protein [Bifidobacteriaceae bacterium]|jgi:uncharacterized membrane protein|nr:TMEM175 family protein [Bifidobacteriaceae bacterium]
MSKTRLEAFSDAVIAIVITILVLELKIPQGENILNGLDELKHQFLIYILSFITIAIYWINHHHLFQATKIITGKILWANTILLLFLSLFPWTTSFVTEYPNHIIPQITYALVMLLADFTWFIMTIFLDKSNQTVTILRADKKLFMTFSLIIIGIILTPLLIYSALIGCAASLLPWIIPSKKIEKTINNKIIH